METISYDEPGENLELRQTQNIQPEKLEENPLGNKIFGCGVCVLTTDTDTHTHLYTT